MSLRAHPILKSIKVGLTIGDPSGIGPAIILKAINELKGLADFTVIGDSWVLRRIPGAGSLKSEARIIDLNNVPHKNFSFGKIKAEYGKASIKYLDKALELLKDKEIDCLVTSPISKEAVNLAGFNYAGHTEYFIKKTGVPDAVMMLLNDKLKFSLVTRHIALKEIVGQLSVDKIYRNICVTYRSLQRIFGLKNPRIVVCGINPHASDNGLIGDEEGSLIKPAIKKIINKLKADVEGPLSSDVAVLRASRREYDCVIAIYHDQALIPLKLSGAETGVNITLGLPFIRTSPLHGTAFDIAKKPQKACPASLIAAVKTAVRCASNLKKA